MLPLHVAHILRDVYQNTKNGMATWPHMAQPTDNGTVEQMAAPVIVSASRRTDIPAFYAEWFFDRLRRGHAVWTNPFNGARSYVSFAKTRFVVFWSKNPRPLLPHLDELAARGAGCYVQYTLNDYESEGLERGVPPLRERVATFRELAARLGKDGVVWRFDPLVLTDRTSVDDLLHKARGIGDRLSDVCERMVFSYADIGPYRKVKRNLGAAGVACREWTEAEMEEFAAGLSAMNAERGWGLELSTCCERIDLARHGVGHSRCIDGDLIVRRAWRDSELMDFMKVKIETAPAPALFGDAGLPAGAVALPDGRHFVGTHKKDPGQRKLCGCMAAKDIGEYDTCPHQCEYCYANTSKRAALGNWERHKARPAAETITGR